MGTLFSFTNKTDHHDIAEINTHFKTVGNILCILLLNRKKLWWWPSCHCQIISNHKKKLWWWPSCHCQIISNDRKKLWWWPCCHCKIISNHRKKLWWWPSCHCQIISNTVVSKLHVCWIFYLAIVTTSYDIMFKAMSVPVVIFSTDQSNNWISYLILDFNLKPWPSTLVHTKYKLNNWISRFPSMI